MSLLAQAAQPPRVISYNIDAVLEPAHHSLDATAGVTFVAPGDAEEIRFSLNPALHVSRVTDARGQALPMEAVSGAVHVTPSTPLQAGQTVTWTFSYGGIVLPKRGITAASLASVGEPVSYLLTAAQWFPTSKPETDLFTASLHIHVPADESVFASGPTDTPHPDKDGRMVFDFDWPHPGFPGTVIAGKFGEPYTFGPSDVRLFLIRGDRSVDKVTAGEFAARAAKLYDKFRVAFGPLPSRRLNVVELPKDAVAAYSAPELAAIAGADMVGTDASRLLANTIAHQWWREHVSPATGDDVWITNGMCRYAELETLKKTATPTEFLDAVRNVSASALAYDAVPLARSAQYDRFSPQFVALTYDKGAMVLRMLRWQIGDAAFQQMLHGMLADAATPVTSAEVERLAEAASHQDLHPFFTQWLDSTGAPTLTDKWTLYRLGGNKGYRTIGEISEDLDLFRMPVEVRIKTKDKTIVQRVEVMGPQSQYAIDTKEIPRKISLDSIRSLASYRLGEVYFSQKNYQAAENAFRDALHGDGLPAWTEVWSDVELGKLFDATGQRERAVNQYREALQTKDNTGGALELAQDYIAHPYRAP